MSKVLRTVSRVAAVVAAAATVVAGVATGNPALVAAGLKVAAIATAVSTVTGLAAQITAPKPVARGSPTSVIIDTEPPRPYMVGESYSAGVLRHRVAYGPTLKKVPNPFLWEVKVFSGVGPVQALVEEQFDFQPIGAYYSGWYASVSQLGARPEATALVPPLNAPATGWGADHKLSGCAAIGGNYKFDKDGKVFASGTPQHGAIWQGEKVYDPRLDSTYPGGSGPCRLGVESTYVYSDIPPLHVGTYAFGRFQNGLKVFGLGLAADGIDWPAIVDWANDCEANGWTCHGTLYEGGRGADVRAQRIQNLDDLCAAGGGRWLVAGALLSFDWHRPRVPLATLTDKDMLEEGGGATAVQSIRERMNGIRPQYIDPASNWQQVTANEIVGTTYRTEDGQPLTQTWALNLVKGAAQAGELAAYALADSREIGPIDIAANSEWRFYKPGETITVNSELLGYNGQAVILQRDLDPQTYNVRLTLKSETPAKHDFALGKVAVPPATPVIGQTQEQRDDVATETTVARGAVILEEVTPFLVQAGVDGQTVTTLPLTRQMTLVREGITLTGTWAVQSTTAGISATINTSGVLSLNTADAAGSITVAGTFEGVDYIRVVLVNRSAAAGNIGGDPGSQSFTDTSWDSVSSASYVRVTDAGAIVQSDGSGEIEFVASASYYAPTTATIKFQYSTDNVSWTDAGSGVTGADTGLDGLGFVSSSVTQTGLTPSTDYYIRLVAKEDSGTGTVDWVAPNFTARQP